MAKQLNVNLAFTADTGKARAQLQELQNILSNLGTSAAKGSSIGITKDLGEAISKATELQAILSKSTTKTGGLDIGKFNQALKQGKTSLKSYADSLSQLGPQGEQAFVQLARAINSAEVPLKKTNAMIDEMMTTLKNTARWQISSSILHGFMGTIQQAYGYTKDLNESLNNIRIVTGYSTDEMASFAKEANRAAKALSTSTTDYTNASLIYYQQGLSESEVKERTDITIKMANVARQSAEVVSDQMTAVWNNFTKSSDASLEHYADVMTALGAATASSTDEIAGGLEKFASIADMIGLSYEYAASALATITATTRQSEDVVGTALKTIFARIQGLSLGETLEDGTNLNKYSEALEKVGISIFEQNGELKDMDKILNDMGSKWNTISKDQQVALAQTVAGVRQYNQLVSLMDNWETFEMNLDIANTSEGALDEQAEIYAESWEAARDRVSAAAEGIYDSLINDDFFIGVDNVLTPILESIESIIDAFGGMSGIIGVVGTMLFKYFGDDFAQSIDDTVYNIKLTSKEGFNEILNLRKEANKQMGETMANSSSNTGEGIAFGTIQEAYQIEKNLSDEVLLKKQQLTVEEKKISDLAEKTLQLKMDNLRVLSDETIAQSKLADEADRKAKIDAKEFSRKFSKDINKNDFSKETVNASLETAKKQEKEYGALLAIQQKIEKSTDKESVSKFLLAIKEGAKNAAGEFGNLEATLDGILKKAEKSGTSVNDIKDLIDSSIDQVGAEAQETYDQIESMTGRADGARKSLEGIQKSATNAGSAFVATASNMQKMDDAAEDVRKDLENLEDTQITLGDSLTAFGEVAIGTFSLIQSTMGLTETWMDGSLSILDKVIATIPILINLTNLLNTVYTKSNLEKIKGIKLGIKNIFVTTGETVAEGAHDAALGKQNKTLAINNALKKAGLKGGLKTLAVMAAILATMALVTAAIKSYQLAQDNAKNASKYAREAAEEQRQEYERLNQEYTSLKESIADYKSALNGLNELTKGSAEYAAALEEANKKARELIESEGLYGDWSYGANGEILIDQNALNQATENKRMEAAKAETRYYSAEQRASQQEETDIINKTRQNTLKQVGTTYSYGEAIPEYDWVDKQELDTMAKASKEEYALAKDYANAKSENADLTIDSFLEGRDLGEVDTSKIKELANTVAELGDSADGTRAQLQKLNSEQDYLTKGYATSIAKQVIGEKKENGTIDSRILGNLNAENALGALVANNEEYKKRVESDAQKANLTYGEGATNENIKKLLNERTDDQIDVAGNGVLNDKELAQMYAQYVKGWDLDKVTYSGGYGKGTIKNEDNEEVTLNDEQMRKELYSALLADKMVEEAKTEKGQKDLGYENAERIVTNILDNAGDVLSNKIYQKEQVNENGEVVTPQKEYLADNIIDEEVQQVLLNAISNTNQQLLDQQGLDAAKKTLDTTQVQALEFDFSELSPEQVNEARAMGEQLGGEVGEAITKGLLDYEEKQNLYWDKLEEKQKAVLDASASREGIDPKIYERQTKNIMENVEALKDNENAAKALAINNTRMNKGVDTLIKNWKSWNKVLKEGDRTSEEFAKATAEVASCIGDLVGLSDGLEEQISSDFLASEETMGLLERAANADTEAITELGFAVAKDLTANFSAAQETLDAFASGTTVDILGETLNETEFYSRLDAVRTELDSWITQIQQDVADNGQLDMLSDEQMGDFASKLNEMAILTGMSVEEMQGYLNSMGLEANIEETPHEVTSMMPVTQTWARRQPLQKETDSNGFQLIGEEYTTTSEYLPVKETRMIPQIAFSSDGSAKPDKPQISYVGHGNISTGNQTAAKNANKSSGSKPKAAEQKNQKI